jgi:type VI secretion system protein ImpM
VSGFFGKIPSHGDFVTRELPRVFLDSWDRWLQECVAASKSQLGEHWLNIYLTSPIWRFALAPGLCGPAAWAGVLMPSVDRVGRYFPFTIAMPLEPHVNALQVPGSFDSWLDAAEAVALRSLDDDRFDAAAVQAALGAIVEPQLPAPRPEITGGIGTTWSMALFGAASERLAADVAATLLARQTEQASLWWTAPPDTTAILVAGLPEPTSFVTLLTHLRDDAGPAPEPSAPTAEASMHGAAAV